MKVAVHRNTWATPPGTRMRWSAWWEPSLWFLWQPWEPLAEEDLSTQLFSSQSLHIAKSYSLGGRGTVCCRTGTINQRPGQKRRRKNRQDVSSADLPWVSIKQLDRRIKWPEHPKTFQCNSWENPNANQPSPLLYAKSSCVDHKLLWRLCWCESPFFLSWGCWFSDPGPAPCGRGTFYSHSILATGCLPDKLGPGALDWATQGNTRAVAKAAETVFKSRNKRLEGFPILTSVLPLPLSSIDPGGWGGAFYVSSPPPSFSPPCVSTRLPPVQFYVTVSQLTKQRCF